MREYQYGEEVEFEFGLLQESDEEKVKQFSCGNAKLDAYIHEEIFSETGVSNEDGLIFKVEDKKNKKIVAIVYE